MTTGIIYRATQKSTGFSYVGQTTRTLEKRKNAHLNTKKPTKFQKLLQAKPDDFEWEIIEDNILIEKLTEKEQHYINLLILEQGEKMLNTSIDIYPNFFRGCHHSLETRAKLSVANKGKNKGKTLSIETRAKISVANKGKSFSPEHRDKMSVAKKGKSHSLEHHEKISEALSKPVIQMDKKTHQQIKVWQSATQAKTELKIHHISKCCLGKQKTAGGFCWKFL